MGMTLAEKILARGAGQEKVYPGELVMARVDMALGNDVTAPVAIQEFKKIGVERVYDPSRIALIPDHFTPNKDIASAQQCKLLRDFSREQKIVHYYEVGRVGVEHALLPELGLALPGEIITGADSHTCTYGALGAFATGVGSTDLAAVMALGELWFKVPPTIKISYEGELPPYVGGKDLILYTIGQIGVDGARYKALEFAGPAVKELSLEGRLTMSNMAVEAGAKVGLIAPDEKTLAYVKKRATRPFTPLYPDKDASYEKEITMNISHLEPQVAFPYSPQNSRPVSEAAAIRVDQVFIGSCTNGRLEDLKQAASILQGRRVHPQVRLIIIPATQEVYRQALDQGLLKIFLEAEAVISAPTCGPCLGGHMGILAAGEVGLATSNRNFVGRMGHPKSQLYLSNPAVAAASALTGRITHPQEIV